MLLRWSDRGGTCSMHGEGEDAWRIFVEKPEGKIPLGRPSDKWKDNIKMDGRETRDAVCRLDASGSG
jgi:hypothetical protein